MKKLETFYLPTFIIKNLPFHVGKYTYHTWSIWEVHVTPQNQPSIINMEPRNHPVEKENQHINLPGCIQLFNPQQKIVKSFAP